MTLIIENQSIRFKPNTKSKKSSLFNIESSIEKITILIKYPKALDRKYVWIPNKNIPTKLLINPNNFAPLKPKDDLKRTAKGSPNFCEGFPIKLQNM